MKKTKRLVALMLTLVMLFSLAACGSKKESDTSESQKTDSDTQAAGNHINACIASEPQTLDPNMAESVDGSTYAHHLFEGLMKYASTGETAGSDQALSNTEIVNGQAESYEVSTNGEGQVVYTFTLRDDISWSDGKPVVAADFEYSWKRIVDPATAASYGYILDGIVVNARDIQAGEVEPSELGVAALDEKTFEVTLESDCPYFVELCAFASLMPVRQDIIEEHGATWTEPENCITNGAFVVGEWVHDSYIKMTPSETFYDAESITPDSVTWWLSDNQTAMMSAFESGDYDFTDKAGIPLDRIADLQESGKLFINPYVGTYFIYINCETVADWRVRAALTLAIDTEYMVESVTQGGETPASGLVPPGISTSEEKDWVETNGNVLFKALQELYPDYDLSDYAGRCELALALYQEAVEDGAWDTSTTLPYLFNTSDAHQAIAEAVQSDWESVLGVSCSLSNQDWAVYTTGLSEGKFGVARMGWIADYNDPITYLEMFADGNNYNYGKWKSDAYTGKIQEAKSLADGPERDKVMLDAESILFGEDGFPISPAYFYTTFYCRADSLQNIEYTAFGYYFFHHASNEK
ncbi:MAG: peptide ABC transporter substrate-binding protein [Lachnospiraceae bacterium]